MEMIKKIIKFIDERMTLDINDDFGYSEIREKEMELLKLNLDDTINLLEQLSSKYYYYISENFEDLSIFFKSNELIECMKRNAKRTGVDCDVDIEYAIKAMNDSDK